MWGMSRSLTDNQIKGLAAYYAAQKPERTSRAIERGSIPASRYSSPGIASAGVPACASCHGRQGQGNATFPRLAGQHADYIVKQLVVFQRTVDRPEGSIMKTVAHSLTRENIDDVAAYLQAMPN